MAISALRGAWRACLRPAAAPRRAHAPLILQMEAVECGAASLGMVLAYHRKFVPLEQLRVACGVSRDGSRASHIVSAARAYGLVARGFRKEPEQLRELPLPMIVFWNFNHFVVVDGFCDDGVHINDPASGRRLVPHAEFDPSFTGIVLTFEAGPQFEPGGAPGSLAASLRQRLAGSWPAIAYLMLSGLCLVLPGLVIPVFAATFIDRVLVSRMASWEMPLLTGMGVTVLLLAALTWLQRRYLLKLEARIALRTAASFFWHVLHLPVAFYQQRSAGDIGARVGTSDRIAGVLSEDLVAGLLGVGTALFFAVVMFFYDWRMSLLTVGVALLNAGVLRRVSRQRVELNQKLSIDRGKVVGASMNGLQLIETLKASGAESDFFTRWAGYQARLMNSMREMDRSSLVLDLMPRFLTAVNAALVLCVGGLRVIDGDLTVGMLVAFQALTQSFVGPVNSLVAIGGKIQGFQGDMDRMDDVLKHPSMPAPQEAPGELLAAKLAGRLELRNVTFGYSRLEPPLLADFNLTVEPGQRVALVGGSGCGKSTISKLITGLYQPWSGEVLFDGQPREHWPRQTMLGSLGSVDQDIALFAGTVRDNLTMWDGTVAHSVLVKAARDACVHELIAARPGGYDGPVAEGGSNFSGGQRQRLEIARALSANPRLLVLDEATSALDPLTEQTVDQRLRQRGCACVIVAHRLSSIRDCDEIVVLERGRVVERGSHAQLLAMDGHYKRLIANE